MIKEKYTSFDQTYKIERILSRRELGKETPSYI
jgi:hypothetical protein